MRGGIREGSGRKIGTKNRETTLRRKITEFFNEGEIRKLVEQAKKEAMEKPEILKFLLEQIFGKAPMRMEMGNDEGGLFKIQVIYGDKEDLPSQISAGSVANDE